MPNPAIVYSGRFNPIHNGHLTYASHVRDFLTDMSGMPDVLFFPVAASIKGKPLVDLDHRIRMLELALAGRTGMQALDLDLGLTQPRTNYQRLLQLRERGIDPSYWVIGSEGYSNDSITKTELDKVVRSGVKLVVVDRLGFEIDDREFEIRDSDPVNNPSDELELITCLSTDEVIFIEKPKANLGISSGKVIKGLKDGIDYTMAPEEVVKYIFEKGLYGIPQAVKPKSF